MCKRTQPIDHSSTINHTQSLDLLHIVAWKEPSLLVHHSFVPTIVICFEDVYGGAFGKWQFILASCLIFKQGVNCKKGTHMACEEHAITSLVRKKYKATSICTKGITLQLHAHWLFKRIIYPLTSQEDNPAIIHPPTFHEVWFGRMVSWRGRGWGR